MDESTKSIGTSDKPRPQGFWGTVLTTTPIVLTVMATVFAGMSSSEMTQSMYYRSLAAQHQSKAGDQWAFFQAKRIRGTSLEMTVELLSSLTQVDPFDATKLAAIATQPLAADTTGKANAEAAARIQKSRDRLAQLLNDEKTKQNLVFLTGPQLPKIESRSLDNKDAAEAIDAVVKAIGQRQTEEMTAARVRLLPSADIEAATQIAEQNADAFDKACEPVNDVVKNLRPIFADLTVAVRPLEKSSDVVLTVEKLNKSYKAAALDYDARRYRQEAYYNRKAAELYEVRVRRSGVESDRHRERSKKFFYSMLVAQAGVTIAAMALAKAQRSGLWFLAAVAGMAALSFSGYVYMTP